MYDIGTAGHLNMEDGIAAFDHAQISQSLLDASLEYVHARCTQRIASHFDQGEGTRRFKAPVPLVEDDSTLATFLKAWPLSDDEFFVLIMAMIPHVLPGFLDQIIQQFLPAGGDFPEFGGVKGQHHRGTLPTGETVLFILAGTDPALRLRYMRLFDDDQFLFRQKILALLSPGNNEPRLSGRLVMEKEFVEVFTSGMVSLPKLSMDFPAEHITTEMTWEDLVLNSQTMQQIHEIGVWVAHHHTLMHGWGMSKKLKPGYRALFYGPPGTGKTLTATLLGRKTGRDVFRIDLSMVVSKYIGETEKNLASLFERAEHKDWILFFDEADAIFGKRTGVRDAHDKYANQEVSYLLQRIESYAGLCILASNFRNNIDTAFIRRFNSVVYFPAPTDAERLLLWKKAFPPQVRLATNVSLENLSVQHDLTGAHIMNIVQYTCLCALAEQRSTISMVDIEAGIRRELAKEGK